MSDDSRTPQLRGQAFLQPPRWDTASHPGIAVPPEGIFWSSIMSTSETIAKTIFQQIACGNGVDGCSGLVCLRSWGLRDLCWQGATDRYRTALGFWVNGYLHQGFVQVELTYLDTYTVRLLKAPGEPPLASVEDVYFDTLCETIDRLVEHEGDCATYARRFQASPIGAAVSPDVKSS